MFKLNAKFIRNVQELCLIASAATLTACASIPLSSALELRGTQLEDIDTNQMEIVVASDQFFNPESAVALISGYSGKKRAKLTLTEVPLTNGVTEGLPNVSSGQTLKRFRLDAASNAELKRLQTNVALKESKREVSFAAYTPGCYTTKPVEPKFVLSIYLKISDEKGFIPLFKNIEYDVPKKVPETYFCDN